MQPSAVDQGRPKRFWVTRAEPGAAATAERLRSGGLEAFVFPLLAVELTMGRAPSLPRTLPEGYVLREMAAVSYPDLPEWISQPFYVELVYGPEAGAHGLWLREYRLLFREYGGIKGIAAASESVSSMAEVDVSGVPGAILTFSHEEEMHTVVWERDGLLLELKTDCLSEEELLRVARSVR